MTVKPFPGECNPNVVDFPAPIDKINPAHYKHLGIECIEITQNMGFLDGNVAKYIYRFAMKGGIEDLDKCDWYLQRLRKKVRGTNDDGC